MLRMRRSLLVVALFALGSAASLGWFCVGATTASASSSLQHFGGGTQDELRTYLDSAPQVVYSRRIADLQAGELDKVFAEVQFTNLEDNYGGFAGSCVFTVGVDTQLILADSPTATSGTAISTPSRTSITADMHHARAVETGSYAAGAADPGPKFVNLVASSQPLDSTCGSPSPHTRVDKGLGRLSVVRYRPTAAAGFSSNYDFSATGTAEAQVSDLQIPSEGQAEAVVYSVQLTGLQAGELLEPLGNAQLARSLDRAVDVSSRLVLAESPTATAGTLVSPPNTFRLTASKYGVAGMSQSSLARNGAYPVPASLAGATRYLNLVVTGTDALPAGSNTLEITSGSGKLEVIRHLPNPVTGSPPAAPTSPSSPAAQIVQAEGMSIPAGSEVIADSQATPSSDPQSVRMTGAGTLSQTITTTGEKTLLTLWASADICATTPGYPNGSTSEGAPIARVTVDGTVVGETQSQFSHATGGFRALPIPVMMPAGSHEIEVAFTNPASKASPACVRRLYVDRIELSAPAPPLERLSGVGALGGGSSAELTSTLPLAPNPDGSVQWRVVYSQPLVQLRRGEVIEAIGEVELVNPGTQIVAAAGRFILADRADQTLSESGSPVISLNGTSSDNISPEMRRVAPSRLATYTATSFHSQTKYLNLVMYAAASGAVGPSDAVNVVADSGRLHVIRHSPLDSDPADVQPPVSAVDSGPFGLTNNATPSFGFSADEPGSSFQCRIDGAAFGACSGPGQAHTPSALPDGPHTFEVRATDPAGNTDAAPASRSFTVDATPPVTQVDSGPSGPTNETSPSFGFSADEPGSSYECRMDGGDFGACSGPEQAHTTSQLSEGPHTFEVRATDPAGNTDATPASRSFTVDATPPVSAVDSGPAGLTNDTTPSFGFSSNEPGSSFQCRIDSASFGACSGASGHTPSALLPDGPHTFEVRATDPAGNTDATPASRSFAVDATPPGTAISWGPKRRTPRTTAIFKFGNLGETDLSAEPMRFECSLDRGRFSPCSTPKRYRKLKRRKHVFRVRAIDDVGNVDPTPAKRRWRVIARKGA